MAKKGEMKPIDAWEASIKENAVSFNIVLFVPGSSSRAKYSSNTLDNAKELSYSVMDNEPNVRSVMIYAIDANKHHALVGTINKQRVWKPVIAKTY